MRPALFGVTIPEGANRVVIRPVLGPGGAQPMYEAPLTVGADPTETQVRSEVARNADFWAYIDSKVRAKKIEVPRDGEWQWKLKLQFFNQVNSEENLLTEGPHEFYRTVGPDGDAQAGAEARFENLCAKSLKVQRVSSKANARALGAMTVAASEAVAKIVEAATKAIATTSSAAAAAQAEVSKQTAVVTALTNALLQETSELKESIFGLLAKTAEARKEPQSMAEQLKGVAETAKTLVGLADSMTSPAATAEAPAATPAGKPAGETLDGKI